MLVSNSIKVPYIRIYFLNLDTVQLFSLAYNFAQWPSAAKDSSAAQKVFSPSTTIT